MQSCRVADLAPRCRDGNLFYPTAAAEAAAGAAGCGGTAAGPATAVAAAGPLHPAVQSNPATKCEPGELPFLLVAHQLLFFDSSAPRTQALNRSARRRCYRRCPSPPGSGCTVTSLRPTSPSGIPEIPRRCERSRRRCTWQRCRPADWFAGTTSKGVCSSFQKEKAGSLYVCGCPGTGRTLSISNVKDSLTRWADEMGMETPDTLAINCTNLGNTSEIFSKILGKFQNRKK